MRKVLIMLALTATVSTAAPALAFAPGSFHVRNETGESLSCGIRHAGSNSVAPIVLRANGEWSATSRTDRPSMLICSGPSRNLYFRLQSGQRYALRKTGAGVLVLSSTN